MISTACVALALIGGGLVQDKEESQLTTIREYRVQVSGPDQLLEPNSQKLAEIINVFPMQRGGVFHGSLYEYTAMIISTGEIFLILSGLRCRSISAISLDSIWEWPWASGCTSEAPTMGCVFSRVPHFCLIYLHPR